MDFCIPKIWHKSLISEECVSSYIIIIAAFLNTFWNIVLFEISGHNNYYFKTFQLRKFFRKNNNLILSWFFKMNSKKKKCYKLHLTRLLSYKEAFIFIFRGLTSTMYYCTIVWCGAIHVVQCCWCWGSNLTPVQNECNLCPLLPSPFPHPEQTPLLRSLDPLLNVDQTGLRIK